MTDTAPAVDRADLGELREIGKGGQGRVWATDSVRINNMWPAVYKEYEPGVRTSLDTGQLTRMVAFVEGLAPDTGRWLCNQAAWPAAVVRQDAEVRGFLMRRIPPDFEVHLPQRDGTRQVRPAGLQYLLNPDDYLAKMAVPITDRKRLLLLASLAETLNRFHELGIVVGDLSPNNLLFQLSDEPACFFLDCDAMRLDGASVLAQAETPDWEVPSGEPLATPESDAYKFGLLAIRLFARDQTMRDDAALTAISPALGELARRSQSPVGEARPLPAQWLPALRAAVTPGLATGAPQAPMRTYSPTTPPQAPPPLPPPPRTTSGRRLGLILAGLMAVLIAVISIGVITTLANADDDNQPAAAPAATSDVYVTEDEPTYDDPTTEEPTPQSTPTIGIVSYDAVAGSEEGTAVAQLFADYFAAVNDRDWATALGAYDPAGVVDPTSDKQRSAFSTNMATTSDSDAVIESVEPAGDETLATVSFTSEQAPGYGPKADPGQTCTRWSISYRLTGSASSGYLILKARDAQYQAC